LRTRGRNPRGVRLLWPLAALTVPATAAVLFHSAFAGLAVRLWMVGVGAILYWAVASAVLRAWTPSEPHRLGLPRAWRRRPPPERLRQLEELEHAVDFSLSTAFDLHFRLRPHLVRIAANRLATRGVDLGTEPARARGLVGPEAWELVRPDREPPEDRAARGIDLAGLRRVVDQLDAI